MAKVSIKKEDYVMIIAGKDKGKTAQVLGIDAKKQIAYIEGKGVTPRKKAVKARKATDRGGIIEFPAVISISNLMPICSACDKPTRVGHKIVDGKKERICVKCGEILKTKKVEEKKAAATVRKRSKKASEVKADEVKAEEVKTDKPEAEVKPKVEPQAEVKAEPAENKPKAQATVVKKTVKKEEPAEKKEVEAKKEEKPTAKKAQTKPAEKGTDKTLAKEPAKDKEE
ncbi:MAG: 50S ribosomal protein L24 [Bacillota bacterium]|jgi:large subunit ribosomal protein L24|nr:50S ribosomal protein L24 [Bacillota bacterium]HHU43049.1 50S ribosomal protein L24 [Clostridiales bacterium]